MDATYRILELRDIGVRYGNGVQALEHVSLEVNEGDLVGILGPNGAGKSTLLNVILGLIKPTSGSVALFGSKGHGSKLKYVGYVPQRAQPQDANFPFTVFETVMLGRIPMVGLFHRLGAGDRRKVEEMLKQFEILELKDRKIGQLSGGQTQRVFLAKAMVSDPKLLLLDEPTSGVDATTKAEFYSTLEHLNKQLGITIILASHEIAMVNKLANKIVCINKTLFFCGEQSEFSAEEVLSKMSDFSSQECPKEGCD